MAVIIGASTTVSFGGACVISANWGYNPNSQRLFCLGSWTAHQTIEKPTETASLTVYSPGPSYDISASEDCTDVQTISLSISPGACGSSVTGLNGSFALTGYSYSKQDAQMPGQETFNFTRWVGTNTPDYVIRGVSEGSASDAATAGIVFSGSTSSSSTGSVSAGGIGQAEELTYGVVTNVGGGSSAAGDTGTGNASVPLTPLWIT